MDCAARKTKLLMHCWRSSDQFVCLRAMSPRQTSCTAVVSSRVGMPHAVARTLPVPAASLSEWGLDADKADSSAARVYDFKRTTVSRGPALTLRGAKGEITCSLLATFEPVLCSRVMSPRQASYTEMYASVNRRALGHCCKCPTVLRERCVVEGGLERGRVH